MDFQNSLDTLFSWCSVKLRLPGYPLQNRENRENGKKNPCQRKHREFGNFAKTQGIWFAQVINSLILKVKDISIFVAKVSKNFQFIFEGG